MRDCGGRRTFRRALAPTTLRACSSMSEPQMPCCLHLLPLCQPLCPPASPSNHVNPHPKFNQSQNSHPVPPFRPPCQDSHRHDLREGRLRAERVHDPVPQSPLLPAGPPPPPSHTTPTVERFVSSANRIFFGVLFRQFLPNHFGGTSRPRPTSEFQVFVLRSQIPAVPLTPKVLASWSRVISLVFEWEWGFCWRVFPLFSQHS